MILRRRGADVLVRAPAKVNLFLEVLHRRADGYHELATLMTAVSLYDTLRFRDDPSGTVRLRCDRPDLSAGPDNLVCRAAELLRRRAGRDLGADVRLWKRIPMQAGLGGGSSDAAAALAGLNALWRLGLEPGPNSPASAPSWAATCRSSSPPPPPGVRAAAKESNPSPWAGRSISCWFLRRSGLSTAEVFRNVTPAGRSADRRGSSPGRGGGRRGRAGPAAAQPIAGTRPNGSAPMMAEWRGTAGRRRGAGRGL